MVTRLMRDLQEPVPNDFLVAFRVFFGTWMALRCVWYIFSGDIDYVRRTEILFSYRGWTWVPHIPAEWFLPLMGISLIAAVSVAVGLWTRVASGVFALTFGYFFIVDASTWGNMDYFCTIVAGLLVLVPGMQRLSIDAMRTRSRQIETPRWVLWLLRFQLGALYFYAGVIKCTSDWLVHAQPLRIFFETENGAPFLAPLFASDAVVHFLAFGGCAFDLLVAFALLSRRTRPVALGFVVFFHSFNFLVLGLGLIPSFMILSTFILFLEPDAFAFLTRRGESQGEVRPVLTATWILPVVAVWVVLQILIPWRHLAYPGDARWNGDGQNFSWWMRSIHMDAQTRFYAVYDGQRVRLNPLEVIAKEQSSMGKDPDLMAQYARHMANKLRAAGHADVRIEVDSTASLNGRPAQVFVKPGIDLAALPPDFVPNDIVEPLKPFP